MTFARSIQIFTACLLLGLAVTSKASPMHIEVIVFANNSSSVKDSEWFQQPGTFIKVDEFETPTEDNFTSNDNPTSSAQPIPVQATRLTKFAKLLENDPDYELLNFLSWTQEPVRKSRTIPVSLDIEHSELQIVPQYLLSGEILVYEVQQLLQFEIDAIYNPIPDISKETVYLPESVTLYERKTRFRLNERRRVQIDEVHYFDHPKFGVIFTTSRLKSPESYVQ